MTIKFYKLKSPSIKIGKNLDLIDTVDGNVLESCNYTDIALQVSRMTHRRANYMYIEDLGRYYFITSHEFDADGLDVVRGHCDVLESWKESILDSTQFIIRQQNEYNLLLIDSMLPRENDLKIEGRAFGSDIFNGEGGYVLITQGGETV